MVIVKLTRLLGERMTLPVFRCYISAHHQEIAQAGGKDLILVGEVAANKSEVTSKLQRSGSK